MDDIKILCELFRDYTGIHPSEITKLAGGGGVRLYYRISGEGFSCIGTKADFPNEAKAFIDLSGVFGEEGINVPEVFIATPDNIHYLQEDLGDVSLFSLLKGNEWMSPADKAVISLASMQNVSESKWSGITVYKPFSKRQAMWDLNYFKYKYLKSLAIPYDEDKLEDDFEKFSSDLVDMGEAFSGFMMRDCQSRNVMVKDGQPYWIDYQGGRKGPLYYDIVSFLWQAKAGFDAETKAHLLNLWKEKLLQYRGRLPEFFDKNIKAFAFFRTLQVLGAYGFRGLEERRAHFIESIPAALLNLRELLDEGVAGGYPELEKAGRYAILHSPVPEKHDGLRIKVFSFSYKKGYPTDRTGNGGGFMFDCRGMHNPGRYDAYKTLTAFDPSVRDFLESKGEVQGFIANAWHLVRPSVESYIKRGFNDLQIGFGCTGGRHRSAYCADKLGRMLAEAFPGVEVDIIHRELGISEELNMIKE